MKKFLILSLIMVGIFAQGADKEKILFVVTSTAKMPSGKDTGLWLEEFALPYQSFKRAGYDITVASPAGGKAPVDKRSINNAQKTFAWAKAIVALETTKPLKEVQAKDFVAIFIPGGHGTMFDLPNNNELERLVYNFSLQEKVIAAVCHGPAGLVSARRADGTPILEGRNVTGFTNAEEKAVQLTKDMPFLLEDRMRLAGGIFTAGPIWKPYIKIDGLLITGQNPASSKNCAEAVLKLLNK